MGSRWSAVGRGRLISALYQYCSFQMSSTQEIGDGHAPFSCQLDVCEAEVAVGKGDEESGPLPPSPKGEELQFHLIL